MRSKHTRLVPIAWLLSAAAATMATPCAWAEDLVQVFDLARAHDAGLAAAQAQLRSTGPRAAQADALLRPTVNASGSSSWARYDPSPSDADPTGERVDTRTSSASLNVRQPLFNRASSIDIAIAHKAVDAAQAEFDATLQEFIVKVAQGYFDVLSAQDVLTATRASKTFLAGQLDAATRNYAAGTAVITDRQDAQARYDLAVAQDISAENELRVRKLALDRLTGRKEIVPAGLAPPAANAPLVPAGLDAWLALAAEHPAVRRATLASDTARLDTDRAKAARLPTVDAVGSYGVSRISGSGSSIGSTLPPGRTQNTSVGVELNIPLFAGHARQNRIAETLILEERAAHALDAASRAAADATERAYFDLQSGQAQVKALEAAEASSRSSLEGTRLAWRAGVRLNLDVLNAQTLLFETQRDLAKARYEVLMRSLKLRAAAGQLRAADLVAINLLLAR